MPSVAVNPPKTPATKGSGGIAAATLPNVCKMPGPPAPFVPTPLPNIGRSGDAPSGYSKNVMVEGHPVAIKGAHFGSLGDAASKATGGGVVSSNTHGPAKFIGAGSFDVKVEGKIVQLLADQMLNNCGSPANSATMPGLMQLANAMMFTEQSNTADTGCEESANHSWKLVEASGRVPLEKKIADAAMSRKQGGLFEGRAAAHNRATGDLKRSAQLSGSTNTEKSWARCSVCGFEREVDQLHDGPLGGASLLVEVKFKAHLDLRDARQLGRNIQAVKQGGASGLIYKLPAGGGGNYVAGQILKLAKIAGLKGKTAITIVRIP